MKRIALFILFVSIFLAVNISYAEIVPLQWGKDYSFENSEGKKVTLHLAYGMDYCEVYRKIGKNIAFLSIHEDEDSIAEGRIECIDIIHGKYGKVKRALFYPNKF